ncbi:Bacterial dynamin-like protein [bacterium HR37]|nr:Bacterial dynamin-like protein [bacterium HR37]
MQIANEKYNRIILEEKALLEALLSELRSLSDRELEDKLLTIIEGLENFFSVVFIGEFSTGKSSIINALLGKKLLPEGITPTTDKVTVIRYGEEAKECEEEGKHVISVQDDRLKGFLIVDTPGTNVTLEEHEKIVREFIPRADIVFFVIGAERAVTESEARLIRFIREEWLKNTVFILNKIDIVEDRDELERLIEYSKREIERIFKIKPFLIPVSARLAIQAKLTGDHELYLRSGMAKLEEYIFSALNEEERIRVKIKSYSELALNLCVEIKRTLESSLNQIIEDTKQLDEFENKLEGIKEEILENSKQFTERIRSRLLEFKTRGIEFIDELIRFENTFKLIRKEKIAKEFESKVSIQTIKELEKDLEALINWAERSERALMESAIDFYNSCVRSTQLKSATGFSYNRSRLMDTVRLELEEKKKQIDPRVLGEKMVDSARGAIASVLGLQVGSLALGAAVVSAFSSVIVDITGILTTIAVIATAFSLLPRKRRNAIKEFSTKVDGLIEELISSVRSQLERDLDGIKLAVLDSLIPLKNFYKTEQKKIIASKEKVNRIYGEILALKESVL